MFVEKLFLKSYRNLKDLELNLSNGVNIFYGNNAQGKTNLLEAIYIASTGRSHRTHYDKDIIDFTAPSAHIKAIVREENVIDKIDIHIKRDSKKGIAINGLPIKKLSELFGHLNVVIFSPEDLSLIKSGPSERRKFIDIQLCQIDNVYCYNLVQYYKVLKQRNNFLKKISIQNSLKENIFIWDEQLIQFAKKIIDKRTDFINSINKISKDIHKKITNGKEDLELIYKPSVFSDNIQEKIEKNIEKDILYKTTSYGPHKDDFLFFINDTNAKDFGSQGQQRTASLSTKLAQIKIIEEQKNSSPVLLLDDVLSELDNDRQKFLIENIKNMQVIITCTGVEDVVKNLKKECKIFKVENGCIFENF